MILSHKVLMTKAGTTGHLTSLTVTCSHALVLPRRTGRQCSAVAHGFLVHVLLALKARPSEGFRV